MLDSSLPKVGEMGRCSGPQFVKQPGRIPDPNHPFTSLTESSWVKVIDECLGDKLQLLVQTVSQFDIPALHLPWRRMESPL